jgi:phosphinothricin acetyltransferase
MRLSRRVTDRPAGVYGSDRRPVHGLAREALNRIAARRVAVFVRPNLTETRPAPSCVEIRDAVPGDADACAEIYRHYTSGADVNLELDPPAAEQFAERIEEALATHAWVVAVVDGDVVGYASARPFMARPAFRWTALVSVYVDHRHHDRGIGRCAYGELFSRLRRRGFKVVLATIIPANEPSLGLHRSLGFEHVGTWPKVAWKRGAWHDLACLQMRLDRAALSGSS